MIRGASKEVERICSGTKNRTELLQNTGCLNHQKKQLDKCMKEYIIAVDGLEKADVRDKIPGSCCTFYSFSECVDHQLHTADKKKCAITSRQYINQMMSTFASDVLNLLCRQTPKGSAACQQFKAPKTTSRTGKAKSILVPFVKAFDSFHPA